ncbi:MAG: hypothetical protein OEU36_11530 [Gammaproteobacteria bacterium]|nr:hypothetical protein [Gammaproteobacteria bacterium]
MKDRFRQIIDDAKPRHAVTHLDRRTGSWIFIVVDDDTLGPAAGGTRMKEYEAPQEGLIDALRLASNMTRKWAAFDMNQGGGKAVLAASQPLKRQEREGMLRRYGKVVEQLGGQFTTGIDLGTTRADIAIVAEETRYVHSAFTTTTLDIGHCTALGVLVAMQVAARNRLGSANLSGVSVLLQGTGNVGAVLARLLAEAGAVVKVSDIDLTRANKIADQTGATVVPFNSLVDESCDVYAPCADGRVLNCDTVPRLRCSIVVGSANDQLSNPLEADRLYHRGILYVPDYIANAGAAIAVHLYDHGFPESNIRNRIEAIGETLQDILLEAEKRSQPPYHTVECRIQARLQTARCRANVKK